MFGLSYLEPVCCKKQQISPNQETGLGNRGLLEALNDTKLILNDKGGHSYSFRTNLVSNRTFRCPLFPKPVSYSKPALDQEIRGNLVHIVSLENSYIISIIDVNSSYLVCQINSCIQMTSNHMLMITLTDDVEGILNKTTDSD